MPDKRSISTVQWSPSMRKFTAEVATARGPYSTVDPLHAHSGVPISGSTESETELFRFESMKSLQLQSWSYFEVKSRQMRSRACERLKG